MKTRAPECPQGPSHVDERKLTGRTSDVEKRRPHAAEQEQLVGMDRTHAHQMSGHDRVRAIYMAACARERLAIVAAAEGKVQICSGTTRQSCSEEKQKEQKGGSNTMIRLDSAQFPSDS